MRVPTYLVGQIFLRNSIKLRPDQSAAGAPYFRLTMKNGVVLASPRIDNIFRIDMIKWKPFIIINKGVNRRKTGTKLHLILFRNAARLGGSLHTVALEEELQEQ